MIIDAHNHPDWHGYNREKFLANMQQCGIGVTWLLSWECPADEYDPNFNRLVPLKDARGPIPFTRCLAYVEHAPDKFVLGYAPDPRRPDAVDSLQAAVEVFGARVCGEVKLRMMYDNPDALRLFRFCGEKGLPVVLHFDYEFDTGARYPRPNWWYGGPIAALERVLQACPDTIFLGHAPGFWSHISGDDLYDKDPYPKGKVKPGGRLIGLLRQYKNLYCDLSAGSAYTALARDPAFAVKFLMEFQDRALFGRDYFDTRHRDFLDRLKLPKPVLAKIYSGNALKLVPLKRARKN